MEKNLTWKWKYTYKLKLYPPVPPPVKNSLYSNTLSIECTQTECGRNERINPPCWLFDETRMTVEKKMNTQERSKYTSIKCAHSHKH